MMAALSGLWLMDGAGDQDRAVMRSRMLRPVTWTIETF
jgi:hypothetical protein